MAKVFVLGSLNMDYVIQVPALPKNGETILGSNVVKTCGGKGANQAVACAKTGSNVTMIGTVGRDSDGEELLTNLHRYDIDTSQVNVVDNPSGCAFITIDKHDNQIVVSPGANAQTTFQNVQHVLERNANSNDYFVTQFETPLEVVKDSILYAKQKGLITILNPSPIVSFDLDLLQYVDYLFMNSTEYNAIFQSQTNFNKAINYGCTIVVTRGDQGSSLYVDEQTYHHKGFPVKPLDTTAAGDTFLGAFLSQLKHGKTIQDILEYANAAGALATQKLGAQASIPSSTEIQEFLNLKENIL